MKPSWVPWVPLAHAPAAAARGRPPLGARPRRVADTKGINMVQNRFVCNWYMDVYGMIYGIWYLVYHMWYMVNGVMVQTCLLIYRDISTMIPYINYVCFQLIYLMSIYIYMVWWSMIHALWWWYTSNDARIMAWSHGRSPIHHQRSVWHRQQRSRRLQVARRRPRGPGPTRAFPPYQLEAPMFWMMFGAKCGRNVLFSTLGFGRLENHGWFCMIVFFRSQSKLMKIEQVSLRETERYMKQYETIKFWPKMFIQIPSATPKRLPPSFAVAHVLPGQFAKEPRVAHHRQNRLPQRAAAAGTGPVTRNGYQSLVVTLRYTNGYNQSNHSDICIQTVTLR